MINQDGTTDALNNSYIRNLLVALDQFGNAIAAGNPDSTISARVGYFAHLHSQPTEFKRWTRFYWFFMEKLINIMFWPVDGPNHCRDAWQSDNEELFREGSDVARVILSGLIVGLFVPITLITYIGAAIYPPWRYVGNPDRT